MDDLVAAIYRHYGFTGVLLCIIVYLVWDKWKDWKRSIEADNEIEQRKKSGQWVSWEELDRRVKAIETSPSKSNELLEAKIERADDHYYQLKEKLDAHFEKEKEEDIKMAEMKIIQENLAEKVEDLKGAVATAFGKLEDNQKECFRLISDTKNTVIGILSKA